MGEGLQLSTPSARLPAPLRHQGQGAPGRALPPGAATALPPYTVAHTAKSQRPPPLPGPLFLGLVRDAVPSHELVEDDDPDEHVHLGARGRGVRETGSWGALPAGGAPGGAGVQGGLDPWATPLPGH